eukprot:1161255-Pelagomonas_calceolata.AAC.9
MKSDRLSWALLTLIILNKFTGQKCLLPPTAAMLVPASTLVFWNDFFPSSQKKSSLPSQDQTLFGVVVHKRAALLGQKGYHPPVHSAINFKH